MSLSLKLSEFMSFIEKRILLKTFFESQFEVISVYEFQTKAISYEGFCWVSVWSNLGLRVSNKTEFLWRDLLGLSLKLCKFMSFKQKRILINPFLESQFGIMQVYEFQRKANSYEQICWVSFGSYVSLWVSNRRQFLQRLLLRFSLDLC